MSWQSRKIINSESKYTGYSLFTKCSFDSNRNKHDYYRVKDCMKNFWKDLREHVMKTTDFELLKILPLKKREK